MCIYCILFRMVFFWNDSNATITCRARLCGGALPHHNRVEEIWFHFNKNQFFVNSNPPMIQIPLLASSLRHRNRVKEIWVSCNARGVLDLQRIPLVAQKSLWAVSEWARLLQFYGCGCSPVHNTTTYHHHCHCYWEEGYTVDHIHLGREISSQEIEIQVTRSILSNML